MSRAAQWNRILTGTYAEMAGVRWWGDQVTDYGQRLEQHQARIDRQIDDLDAMLADYRSIGK